MNDMKMAKGLNYTVLHSALKDALSGEVQERWTNENGIGLWKGAFNSSSAFDESMLRNPSESDIFFDPELAEKCNEKFNYYIFVPDTERAGKECIVLLHGLNERNWDKYLPWAYSLAERTGISVVMFPIAYHMDRSPDQWKDPRVMMPYVKKRRMKIPRVSMTSVANVALCERLTAQPERLFFSGYQAAGDVMKLMDTITSGSHPVFEKGTTINFFSYSIGTFLTQIMMLANPGNRFDNSKFVFFCGGSAFDDIQGVSKYILDSKAYTTLKKYYNGSFEQELKNNPQWKDLFESGPIGESFRAMLSVKSLKYYGGNRFSGFSDRLMTMTLKHDKVIIPEKVKSALAGTKIEELDFDYGYLHENPFPVFREGIVQDKVNASFDKFITKASLFFA